MSATTTIAISEVSVHRARGRIVPRMRGSSMRAADEFALVTSGRPGSFEPEADLPDRDLIAIPERRHGCDGSAVDVRAVSAAEILDVPAPSAVREDRVLCGRERVVDDDRVVYVAPEGRDRIEVERASLLGIATRRIDHDQPAEGRAWLARRRTEVAHQRPNHPGEEDVQKRQEQQPYRPDDEQHAVHQVTSPATSTTMTVSPISMRSPAPRTSSPTCTPFTRDPLVLPRSAYTRV